MTRGSIGGHLIRYAVPMILGNLLQLSYNAADSVIIGKCLGEDALAAVSSSNPIMTIMVLGASGLGIGASVIMSRCYGAGDRRGLRREFSTTLIFGTLFSLGIFLLGQLLAGTLLEWIKVPDSARGQALVYLRLILVGFLFTFQYNILSASLRALGDSKTPVLFLSLSCLLNVGLDLLLVAALGMDTAGAALATTLSEGVSAALCLIWIRRRVPELWPNRKDWGLDRALLGETVKTGALTALQQAAQPVGKLLIQRVINLQGVTAIDAFNAVCRVDDFACIPAQSIGSGIMTCTAQNRGAGREDRVRQSLKTGLLTALGYFPLILIATLLLRRPAMVLLTPEGSAAMQAMGVEYLGLKAWLFVLPCLTNAVQGWFRGLGRMRVVLAATVLQISLRTIFVHLLVPRLGIVGEAWACMIGWLCMLVFEGLYYLLAVRRKP